MDSGGTHTCTFVFTALLAHSLCYHSMTVLPQPFTILPQGKLTYREHVTEGFDNMFDAFLGLFKGDNIGKAVVRA